MKFQSIIDEKYADSAGRPVVLSIWVIVVASDGDAASPVMEAAVADVMRRVPAGMVNRTVWPMERAPEPTEDERGLMEMHLNRRMTRPE